MNHLKSNLNLDIRYGHRNQLGVTHRNQTGPKSGPKLDLFFCSHEKGMIRYRTVTISGSLFRTAQVLDMYWNGPLDIFRIRVDAAPSPYHFLGRNGTVRYRSRVNRTLVIRDVL